MIDVIGELRKVGRSVPERMEPIPVVLPDLGQIGHVENKRGLYVNSALKRHVKAILRDHQRFERAAWEATGGKLSAGQLLAAAALGTDRRDAIRAIKQMSCAAMANWNAVATAISNGQVLDIAATKATTTTVSLQWHSFLAVSGFPRAMSFGNIPGPPAITSTTAGVIPIPAQIGAGDDLYLTNFGGAQTAGNSEIVMLVDVLNAAGNILTSIVTSQAVNTTALTRWTGGAGVMMTLEVQTAPGASTGVPNITIEYVDQSGGASTTGAIAEGVTSPIVGRLIPLQDGPLVRLAAGDFGVRSITSVQFSISSAGAGGRVAAIQYKPVLLAPLLQDFVYTERSTPAQMGAIRRLTSVSGGNTPGLGMFVLSDGTSVTTPSFIMQAVWG